MLEQLHHTLLVPCAMREVREVGEVREAREVGEVWEVREARGGPAYGFLCE